MKVTVRKNTLYFDEEATTLIKQAAKREHRTFKKVVIAALWRGVRRVTKEAKERMESPQVSRRRRS